MSAPTKLTPDRQKVICDALRAGESMEQAAARAQVSRSTLYEWRQRGDREPDSIFGQFGQALTRAREASEFALLDRFQELACGRLTSRRVVSHPNGSETVTTWEREDWRGPKALLELRWPERYGRRRLDGQARVSDSDKSGPPIDLSRLTPEEVKILDKLVLKAGLPLGPDDA